MTKDERLAQIRAWERSGKATALFDIYADIRFLLAELDAATEKLADYEAAAKYPGDDQRHRGASVASQLVHAQHMREQAETELESLRAKAQRHKVERDAALAHNEKLTARAQRFADVMKNLLAFQYAHKGMGTYTCRSCGAQVGLDDDNGQFRGEKCSPNCPWEVARTAIAKAEEQKD